MQTKEQWLLSHASLSARDHDLLSRAYDVLAANTVCTPNAPWSPYRCISPWINHITGIWNWDTAFHAIATSHFDTSLSKECLMGFMQFQLPNGMFPDVIYLNGNRVEDLTKPPVLPWAAWKIYQRDGDRSLLAWCYPRFVANEQFWCSSRFSNGMFHYASEGTPEEVAKDRYLHARYESGWDNSPRWDAPIIDYHPIDLNCFMIMFYRAMRDIADVLTLPSAEWAEKEKQLTDAVLANLWDPQQKCFVDRNFRTGAFSKVITPASFMPLYIKIATYDQAESMQRIAADPARFYPGMPSVSYDDPTYSEGYWRGPTWLNIAYFAAKGLLKYGFAETANGIREFILNMVSDNHDGIYENYNSRERKGLYWHSFSWSACFVIAFILDWNQDVL